MRDHISEPIKPVIVRGFLSEKTTVDCVCVSYLIGEDYANVDFEISTSEGRVSIYPIRVTLYDDKEKIQEDLEGAKSTIRQLRYMVSIYEDVIISIEKRLVLEDKDNA